MTTSIVQVACHVKADAVAAFREATLKNARASVQEAGIARFDVLEDRAEPTRFLLVFDPHIEYQFAEKINS